MLMIEHSNDSFLHVKFTKEYYTIMIEEENSK